MELHRESALPRSYRLVNKKPSVKCGTPSGVVSQGRVLETPKIIQATAITLGYSLKLDSKDSYVLITTHRKIKLI